MALPLQLIALTIASLVAASSVSAQTWSFSGPGGASVNVLAIDPWTPATLYAGTELGLFKSTDGGAGWSGVLFGKAVNAVAVDPLAPATVYAGTPGGLQKSTDGGQTWREVVSTHSVNAIAVDPWNPGTIYVAGIREVLLKTTDGGEHWTSITQGLDTTVISLTMDPWRPTVLYAGTSQSGVFKTDDGGAHWYPVRVGVLSARPEARTIAIDPWEPDTVYFSDYYPYDSVTYFSTNGGWPWEVASGAPPTSVASLAIDPDFPFILYAGSAVGGVYRSLDRGRTWSAINTGLSSRRVTSIAIDPEVPSTVYAGTSDQGIFKSTNRGEAWVPVNRGLFGVLISELAVDPWTSTVYAAGSGGLYTSADYGRTWNSLTGGIITTLEASSPAGGYDAQLNSVAIDVWSPTTLYVGTQLRDVLKSTNGGQQWVSTLTPSDFWTPMNEIVLDPFHPGTIYAGSAADLIKSVDGAAHWTSTGYPTEVSSSSAAVLALAIHPRDPNILYGVNNHFLPCYPSCSRTAESLLITLDAGANWFGLTGTTFQSSGGGSADVAIDPATPSNVFVTFGSATVYRTGDGGLTWNLDTLGLESSGGVITLAVDPHAPGTVYAGASRGVFRSVDGGQTWTPLSDGLFERPVFSLAFDPWVPGLIYAGTDIGVFVLD